MHCYSSSKRPATAWPNFSAGQASTLGELASSSGMTGSLLHPVMRDPHAASPLACLSLSLQPEAQFLTTFQPSLNPQTKWKREQKKRGGKRAKNKTRKPHTHTKKFVIVQRQPAFKCILIKIHYTFSRFIATSFYMCYKRRISTKTCINTEELLYLVSGGLKCVLQSFADGEIVSQWFQESIKLPIQTRDLNSVPDSGQRQFTTILLPQMLWHEGR